MSKVSGSKHHKWRGGVNCTYHGYIRYSAGPHRHKLVHRVMLEQLLGRPLEKHKAYGGWEGAEEVHHQDFDRTHNELSNFILMWPGRAWQRAQHVNKTTPRNDNGTFRSHASTSVDPLDGDDAPDWVTAMDEAEDGGGGEARDAGE